jgi:hypothetical protein
VYLTSGFCVKKLFTDDDGLDSEGEITSSYYLGLVSKKVGSQYQVKQHHNFILSVDFVLFRSCIGMQIMNTFHVQSCLKFFVAQTFVLCPTL